MVDNYCVEHLHWKNPALDLQPEIVGDLRKLGHVQMMKHLVFLHFTRREIERLNKSREVTTPPTIKRQRLNANDQTPLSFHLL